MQVLKKFLSLLSWTNIRNSPTSLSCLLHLVVCIILAIKIPIQNKHKIYPTAVQVVSLSRIEKKNTQHDSSKKTQNTQPKKEKLNVKEINNAFDSMKKSVTKERRKEIESEFESVLKDIKKNKKNSPKNDTKQDINQMNGEAPISTDDEMEIKRQIYPRWSIPAGIKNAENYYVDVDVTLAPDGSVLKTALVSDTSEKQTKVLAESAIRAVLLASPIKFKNSRKTGIRRFILRFDLKEALAW